MPPKKGSKRKAAAKVSTAELNGDAHLTPPDRDTWPGWVEMESEPAFFNVMLKDMGVKGVKMQEVITGLDPDDLAVLPQPIHAFIFLFRYKDAEMTQTETECPTDIWFANQIPEFACASVALLNIVNNIKGLQMGKELRDFKDFTKDLDPVGRGDAIDGFDFLKRIHNSFARETDLLNADMHMQNKINKAKRRKAANQAKATKKAKKSTDTPAEKKKRTDSAVPSPTRASKRTQKPTTSKTNAKTEVPDSGASSPLSDPPDSDPEFETSSKAKKSVAPPAEVPPRRSGSRPKPLRDQNKIFSEEDVSQEMEGFHYIAYVPVNGRVWKLDGLDSYPHLVGDFDAETGGEWTNVAGPDIQAQMMMFEGSIQYSLMAVVHDPIISAKTELAENIKELHMIDAKLDEVSKDWRSRNGADPSPNDVVLGPCPILDLAPVDIASASTSAALEHEVSLYKDAYIDELVKVRQQRVERQAPLRNALADEVESSKREDEMGRMRRHDFGGFVKGWLGALAEQEVLKDLVDEAV